MEREDNIEAADIVIDGITSEKNASKIMTLNRPGVEIFRFYAPQAEGQVILYFRIPEDKYADTMRKMSDALNS